MRAETDHQWWRAALGHRDEGDQQTMPSAGPRRPCHAWLALLDTGPDRAQSDMTPPGPAGHGDARDWIRFRHRPVILARGTIGAALLVLTAGCSEPSNPMREPCVIVIPLDQRDSNGAPLEDEQLLDRPGVPTAAATTGCEPDGSDPHVAPRRREDQESGRIALV